MRITCRYSGVSFQTTFFDSLQLAEVGSHPIMEIPTKNLLGRVGQWGRGELSATEKKLLFIALLKSTGLVEFRVPAEPTKQVVERYMELLMKSVLWKEEMLNIVPLPKLAITHETKQLTTIGHWLGAWNDARRDWETQGAVWRAKERLRLREAALSKLIKSSMRTKTQDTILSKQLASWALEASAAPSYITDYWTTLLLLKDNFEIFQANAKDLDELRCWMEDNIDVGTIYGHHLMRYIYTVVEKNRRGLEYGIGLMDQDDKEDNDGKPYTIIDDSIETYNRQVAAAMAPAEEPHQKDYDSKVEFLRAKARWNIAQQQLKDIERLEKDDRQRELNLPPVIDDDDDEPISIRDI